MRPLGVGMAITAIPAGRIAAALREGEEASAAELLALASSKDVRVRESLAARTDLPLATLLHLAQDVKASVRVALAKNPAIGEIGSVVSILTNDMDQDVLLALVGNPMIAPLRVRILLDHPRRKVRDAVEARLAGRAL